MFKVYWTEAAQARSADFDSADMTKVLAQCEALRARQRAGEPVSFICLVSENPDSVTKPGVDVTGPEYDWKKRRV